MWFQSVHLQWQQDQHFSHYYHYCLSRTVFRLHKAASLQRNLKSMHKARSVGKIEHQLVLILKWNICFDCSYLGSLLFIRHLFEGIVIRLPRLKFMSTWQLFTILWKDSSRSVVVIHEVQTHGLARTCAAFINHNSMKSSDNDCAIIEIYGIHMLIIFAAQSDNSRYLQIRW